MSVSLRVNNEFLDLKPGTEISRERNSPFFLSLDANGNDGIPAEISYPFDIPITDKNSRLLQHADYLPAIRAKVIDNAVYDDFNQVSAGKLQIGKSTFSLNRTNSGSIKANLLCNSSAFAALIAGKKLSDLLMGGPRVFGWAGFNLTNEGFWKHVHSTWEYADCDDGDYVFFPVKNEGYGAFVTFQNLPIVDTATGRVRLTSDNVMSLTPHIYLHYIIRCIFNEHGYTVGGDLMEDPDFKKLCMLTFRSVYWSEIKKKPSMDGWVQLPLAEISMRLNEHMPPDWGIGQFLVELQKLLPIGFDINDNSRHCSIKLLGRPSEASSIKDMTAKVSAVVSVDQDVKEKTYAIKRNFGTDGLAGTSIDLENADWVPTRVVDHVADIPVIAPVGAVYLVKTENAFYAKQDVGGTVTLERIGYNTGSYVPEGNTNAIECAMVPVGMTHDTNVLRYPLVSPSTYPNYVVPHCAIEGNWQSKTELAMWGVHLAFYKGMTYPVNNGAYYAPYATNSNNKYVLSGGATVAQMDGGWSLGYELGGAGLVDVFWQYWLKILRESERLEATLVMPLHEYMQLNWSDEILIENVSFIIKKMQDVIPYPGTVQIEALRWIKS